MRRRVLAASAAVLLAGLAAVLPAAADIALPGVSANPVDNTPHVLDGEVRALALVGDTVIAGGEFSLVREAGRQAVHKRSNLFAYSLSTGRIIPGFAPALDGPVLALAAGPRGTAYLGGAFQQVNGASARGLAQLELATGGLTRFRAQINWGDVRGLAARNGVVYAAGSFTAIEGTPRVGLARLNGATGAVDPSFDLRLAAPNLTRVKLDDLALSPDGSRLVAVGAVQQAGGQYRAQIAMIDTFAMPARVADWYTDAYTRPCRTGFETYLRGVDFAPDGSWFAVVTTGRMTGPQLMCDTVARFETGGTGLHRPSWVNYTGGDSLYSVAVTGSVVYVGGHQRWMDNPLGRESPGPGAKSRTGIASVDSITGRATDWNPTRRRGIGARALLATRAGLIVGSDTEILAKEYHGRIGMFPVG